MLARPQCSAQVLQPEVRMLMLRRSAVHPFSSVHSEFIYSELKSEVRK